MLLPETWVFQQPHKTAWMPFPTVTFVLDFLFFACTLLMHLSRFSEDLILYTSAEFSFVQMDDSVASGSSLMPQKKNPDALELIRGKAGRVYGHLMSLLTVLKGLPMTYNKDLQEDKEGLFDAITTVEGCLGMIQRVLETIRIDPERMREAATKGYLNATELADYLVARKMPFREAHSLVGKIVMRVSEIGIALEDLPLREYQSFSPLFRSDLFQCLSLKKHYRDVGSAEALHLPAFDNPSVYSGKDPGQIGLSGFFRSRAETHKSPEIGIYCRSICISRGKILLMATRNSIDDSFPGYLVFEIGVAIQRRSVRFVERFPFFCGNFGLRFGTLDHAAQAFQKIL